MKNSKLILVILGVMILGGGIFFLQNTSPVLSLVFFGTQTVSLPVGLWLVLSAIAGLLSSLILQLLLGVYPPPKSRSRNWDYPDDPDDEPDSPNPPDTTYRVANPNRYQSEENSSYNTSERASYGVSNPKAFQYDKNDDDDWELPLTGEDWNQIDEEWDIEQPPRRPNPPPPSNNDEDEDETLYSPPDTTRNIDERPQTPKETSPQEGSVYSYRYRETDEEFDDSENDKNDDDNDYTDEPRSSQVYEANYRVIRPPLWNLPDEEEEDLEEDDKEQR